MRDAFRQGLKDTAYIERQRVELLREVVPDLLHPGRYSMTLSASASIVGGMEAKSLGSRERR